MKTGWKSRNRPFIEEAVAEATVRGMERPTLIDIAPGLVTRALGPYFPPVANAWSRLLTPIDRFLRRTGRFEITCHEIDDILRAAAPLNPDHLYVLHADPAAAQAIPESDLVVLSATDLLQDPLLALGDIVFCYNAIRRTHHPKDALENVLASVKVGGLISIDEAGEGELDPRSNPMFLRLSPNLYVKEF